MKLDADGALVYDGGVATHIPPATNNLVGATAPATRSPAPWPASSAAKPQSSPLVSHHHLGVGDRHLGAARPDARLRATLRFTELRAER